MTIAHNLAPILLITFNRPNHFKKALSALSQNKKSEESILYISIDGPRNKNDIKNQRIIHDHIKLAEEFFAKINIIQYETNQGLAKHIVKSVSSILNKHEKIIVLEDDLITSISFLNFMNDALSYYQEKKKVWHINGYSPINNLDKKDEIFLSRLMHCWGWATWTDRWMNFNKNPNFLVRNFSKKMIYKFNLNGEVNLWDQVLSNSIGKTDTWAIFWYSNIYIKNGLCVFPWWTHVKNIGFDDSGVNCSLNNKNPRVKIDLINDYGRFTGIDNLIENKYALKLLQKLNNRNFIKSLLVKLVNKLIGYNLTYKLKSFLKLI